MHVGSSAVGVPGVLLLTLTLILTPQDPSPTPDLTRILTLAGAKPELPLGVPRASRCYIYVVACVSSLSDPNPRGAKPELPLGVPRASRCYLCCGVCEQPARP